MKLWISLGALSLLPLAAQAGIWSDLWHRPDQQGERALEAGDPQRAASLYTDPRRQAYAQLKAGQYAQAAQRLAPFSDAQSQYNRGNALARGGELSSALNAYEATLKHPDLDPALRRDAEHNRDLVAQQLKSQNSPQKSQDSPQKNGQSGQPSAADKQAGSQGDPSKGNPSQDNPSQDNPSQDKPSQSNTPQSNTPQSNTAQSNTPQSKTSQGNPSSQGNASQVSSESAEAGRAQQKPPGSNERAAADGKATAQSEAKPQTEQQLALEQWLRQIPDDPGGLLRRKFLVEHLMKQEAQP